MRAIKVAVAASTFLVCVSVVGFCYPSAEDRDLKKIEKTVDLMNMMNTIWQGYSSLQAKDLGGLREGEVAQVEQLNWDEVGTPMSIDRLTSILVPKYGRADWMSGEDAWGHPLEFRVAGMDLIIRSPGRDGTFSEQPYFSCVFEISDVDQDIVVWGGKFKRRPLFPLEDDWLLDEYMIRQAEKDRARQKRCD
ncbi:MAG: hypothetical protein GY722_10555 [bacterium]|nr:hypothetical protein [bacterium]